MLLSVTSTVRVDEEMEAVKRHWQSRKRGPCRLALGERLVDGEIHQVLACGHTIPPILDTDGLWVHEARDCAKCLDELRKGTRLGDNLPRETVEASLELVEDNLDEEERKDVVHRALHWFSIRLGRKVPK